MKKKSMQQLIESLGHNSAELINALYNDGYTYESLAEEFGVPVDEIKADANRARSELIAALDNEQEAA